MSLDINKLTNPFVRAHLEYVAQTEPPAEFHAWAAISCMSACMGRHLWTEDGLGRLHGNLYVLLVGPPATRKSTALKLAVRVMQQYTDVRFTPDDTGGQRQGLIQAFIEHDEEDADESENVSETAAAIAAAASSLDTITNAHTTLGRMEDRHALFAFASEFGIFIGQNNLDFTRFLIKIYDGENYEYKLRAHKAVLRDPILALAGGTTPDDMAVLLPPEAMGQGFTSRIILVYAPTKGRQVPPSQIHLDDTWLDTLSAAYRRTWYDMHGEMSWAADAAKILDRLYLQGCKIEDTRFIYYAERRFTHLRKVAMTLAAARGSMQITLNDVLDAQLLLQSAEHRMPEALGEYGLSPVAVAKQKLLEYLRHADEPVSERVLWAIMQRDVKLIDFNNMLGALVAADKITAVDAMVDGKHKRMYRFNDLKEDLARVDEEKLDALLANI